MLNWFIGVTHVKPPPFTCYSVAAYDCPAYPGVFEHACVLAGATMTAATCLMSDLCDVAVNWCGGWHHAKRWLSDLSLI